MVRLKHLPIKTGEKLIKAQAGTCWWGEGRADVHAQLTGKLVGLVDMLGDKTAEWDILLGLAGVELGGAVGGPALTEGVVEVGREDGLSRVGAVKRRLHKAHHGLSCTLGAGGVLIDWHIIAEGDASILQGLPGGYLVVAWVFDEVDTCLERRGEHIPELECVLHGQRAIEIDTPLPRRNNGSELDEAFHGGRKLRQHLELTHAEALLVEIIDLTGSSAHREGRVALRDAKTIEKITFFSAGLGIDFHAAKGGFTEAKGGAIAEGVQFIFEGGVAEFGPGLEASITAIIGA